MAAAKKGGLGKGIDSLIPNKVSATKTEAKNENVKNDKVIEGVLVNISLCLYRTEKDIMRLLPASADGVQQNLPD